MNGGLKFYTFEVFALDEDGNVIVKGDEEVKAELVGVFG